MSPRDSLRLSRGVVPRFDDGTCAAGAAERGSAGRGAAAGFLPRPGLATGAGLTAGARCSDGAGAGVLRSAADAPGFASPFWKAFFNLRATGASTVEEADFTNSPMSLSLSRTVLLSTPKSLASSYTRFFATLL